MVGGLTAPRPLEMDYNAFRILVAAAAQRSVDALTSGTTDLIALAANMARKSIERGRDFEMAKTTADITITLGQGADLSTTVLAGTVTPVKVKTILRAQASTNGGTSFVPIGVTSRQTHFDSWTRRVGSFNTLEDVTATYPTETHKFQLVRYANTVYMTPSDTVSFDNQAAVLVRMDIVKWLDNYAVNGPEDFLLEHCFDYMLLVTLCYLQLFVKEDVRLPVTDVKMKEAWMAMIQWDSNVVVTSDDMNLN